MNIRPEPYLGPIISILNDSQMQLVQPFTFEWVDGIQLRRIMIPTGFVTDGASVPRVCWTLTGLIPTGVHLGAAVVHDYLYEHRGHLGKGEVCNWDTTVANWVPDPWLVWDRHRCDRMFLQIMKSAGETEWKAYAMFWAVWLFGGAAWNN